MTNTTQTYQSYQSLQSSYGQSQSGLGGRDIDHVVEPDEEKGKLI